MILISYHYRSCESWTTSRCHVTSKREDAEKAGRRCGHLCQEKRRGEREGGEREEDFSLKLWPITERSTEERWKDWTMGDI